MMNTKPRHINIDNTEFDWLGYCTSCNVDCCHNMDKSLQEYECNKPSLDENYMFSDGSINPADSINNVSMNKQDTKDSHDYRPLECRLFPFDITEIDQKLVWIVHDQCRVTPKLDYEKSIKFIEGYFFRTIPLEKIQKYIENNKLTKPEKYEANNFKIIGEVNWPS